MRTSEAYSNSEFEVTVDEEEVVEEQSELWSVSSVIESDVLKKLSRSRSVAKSKSFSASARSLSKLMSKSLSKFYVSKTLQKTYSSRLTGAQSESSVGESASSDDDILVHAISTVFKYVFFIIFFKTFLIMILLDSFIGSVQRH